MVDCACYIHNMLIQNFSLSFMLRPTPPIMQNADSACYTLGMYFCWDVAYPFITVIVTVFYDVSIVYLQLRNS